MNSHAGMRDRAGAGSPCLKSFPAVILSFLLFNGAMSAVAQAQNEEEELPPTPRVEALPPEAYDFAMKLPPGTDCSVRVKLAGRTEENASAGPGSEQAASEDLLYALRIERMFRNEIRASKQINSDGSETTYYFLEGWCVYDRPGFGLNVRRYLDHGQLQDLSVYHFPELTWAVPGTRQPDPKVAEGEPAIHVYKDGDIMLVTDAVSGYPLQYSDGNLQWTYSYKRSDTPVVLPAKLQQAFDRIVRGANNDLSR